VWPTPSDEQIKAAVTDAKFGFLGAAVQPVVTRNAADRSINITMNYSRPLNFLFFEVGPLALSHSRTVFVPRAYVAPSSGSGGTGSGKGSDSGGGKNDESGSDSGGGKKNDDSGSDSGGGKKNDDSGSDSGGGKKNDEPSPPASGGSTTPPASGGSTTQPAGGGSTTPPASGGGTTTPPVTLPPSNGNNGNGGKKDK
jgi:hypothetical protein